MTRQEQIQAHELLESTQKQLREIHDKLMENDVIDKCGMKQLYRAVEDAVYYCAQSKAVILQKRVHK